MANQQVLNQAQFNELQGFIARDDRTGFYAKLYHQYTGSEAAFLMGQISRGSDINGGVAYRINAQIEKYAPLFGDTYPSGGIVPFSKTIAANDLDLIRQGETSPGSGVYEVPKDLEMLKGAHDVWVKEKLGDYFPGNSKIALTYLADGDLSNAKAYANSAIKLAVAGIAIVDGVIEILGQGWNGLTDYGHSATQLLNAHPAWTSYEFDRDGHHIIQVLDENGVTQGLFRPQQNLIDWNEFHGQTVDGIADQFAEFSIPHALTMVADNSDAGIAAAAQASADRAALVEAWKTALTNEFGLQSGDDIANLDLYRAEDGGLIAVKPDGTTLTINKDASWETHSSTVGTDGSRTDQFTRSDGSTALVAQDSSGATRVYYQNADGTGGTASDDGHGDFSLAESFADGTTQHTAYRHADGSSFYSSTDAQGNQQQQGNDANGVLHSEYHNADGSHGESTVRPDGSLFNKTYDADGSTHEYVLNADGSSHTEMHLANGAYSEETRNADGSLSGDSHDIDVDAVWTDDGHGNLSVIHTLHGDLIGTESHWATSDGHGGDSWDYVDLIGVQHTGSVLY